MLKEKVLYALMLIFICIAALWLLSSARAWADDMDDLSVAPATDNLVQLDGSSSSDPDGDQLIYRWRQVGGPLVRLINSTSARPSFHPAQAGKYSFELTVSDGKTTSAPAVVDVEVERANRAPQAVVEPKLGGKTGQRLTIDASRSADPDGDPLRYFWRQVGGPTPVIRDKETVTPQLNLVFPQEGRYTFELVAGDGTARSNPVRCEVMVVNPNAAPVARINQPSQKIALRLPGGEPAPEARQQPAALDNDNPPAANSDRARIARLANEDDFAANKDKDAVLAGMRREGAQMQNAQNARPVRPEITATGRNVRTVNTAQDVQSAPATQMSAPRGDALDQGVLSGGTGSANALNTVTGAQTDSAGLRRGARGGQPIASTSGNQMVEVGEHVLIRGKGTDPAGGQLRYTWRQTGGPKLDRSILNRSRDLEFTPNKDDTYLFELFVSNDLGEVSEPATVAVTVAKAVGDLQGLVGNDELLAEASAGNTPSKENKNTGAAKPTAKAGSKDAAGADEDVPGIGPVPGVESKGNGMFARVFRRTPPKQE